MQKKVTLITDGACLGNPGPGGWAFILRYKKHEKIGSGNEPDTTNNRMELMAVIQGLTSLSEPCAVTIRSDSKYIIDAFEQGWLKNWQNNGWRNAQNKPVKNQDLWQSLIELEKKHKIAWEWIKGHSGDADNERVDEEARNQASNVRLSP